MKRLLAAALLLVSCATVSSGAGRSICRTPCGLATLDGSCEDLQRYEGRVLKRLAKVGINEERVCRELARWTIKIHKHDPVVDKGCSERGWRLNPTFCAAGLTSSSDYSITLSVSDWEHSALAHEIVHVYDYSTAGHMGHCRWNGKLRAALKDLTGDEETQAPETECRDGGVP